MLIRRSFKSPVAYSLKYFVPRIASQCRIQPRVVEPRTSWFRRLFKPMALVSSAGLLFAAHKNLSKEPPLALADLYNQCNPSVVHLRLEIKTDSNLQSENLVSNGSGFVIRADGLILTNAHVVTDMSIKSKLKIKYFDGTLCKGEVVCLDHLSDLALVRPVPINSESLPDLSKYPPVQMANENSLRVGDSIFTIGSPYGLLNAMSSGVVSGLNRTTTEMSLKLKDERVLCLQTDLHLFPGNSGGPVFDLAGRVVGISTVKSEGDGLSFAIQVGSVQRILEQMLQSGRVRRAWLGFRAATLNPEIQSQLEHSEFNSIKHGVMVLKSYPRSPASSAGILPGDVVVAVNDAPIEDVCHLFTILDDAPVGQPVKLEIKRILLKEGRICSMTTFVLPDEYDVFSGNLGC